MNLSLLIQPECMPADIPEEKTVSKKTILEYFTDILIKHTTLANEDAARDYIIDHLTSREEQLSTAAGEGFAFPHARLENLKKSYLLFAVSKKGVEFASPDGKPVHFIFFSLAANDDPNLLIHSRAAIIRFLMLPGMKEKVLAAKTSKSLWKLIDESGVELDRPITARDIMNPPEGCVYADMKLHEAALALRKYHSDSLPILDKTGKFKGDISCYDLFMMGMPDMYFNVDTFSYDHKTNPFDKYFLSDTTLTVADLKEVQSSERAAPVLSPDATLVEIIYTLTNNQYPTIYVVEKKRLIGVIDRFSIVDKILISSR